MDEVETKKPIEVDDIGDDFPDIKDEPFDRLDSGSSFLDSPIEKHNDLLKELSNFDPYLKRKAAEWLGMYWSEKEDKYVQDESITPTMNVHGVRWCINLMRTYARENNLLTSLDRDTYEFIMCDVVDLIFVNIGTRHEEFGIEGGDGDILKICYEVIHTAQLVLIGASGNDTYRGFFEGNVSRNETINIKPNDQQPQQNGGFFGRVRSFLGG